VDAKNGRMTTGRKTGGRRRGTPNKVTAERQAAVTASGKTLLAVMLENMRWADDQARWLSERLLVPSLRWKPSSFPAS